ncbi:uncharacterized protein LOC126783775 [Argentina anserina]|uniref:uncharacterized protein LOC126783775 n=1 Tax=Argentina anserina TaxID=57926 RepID=UPI0021763543|nr:uncharacterized protein LOC126783775 [Potentilla anserina]
MMNDYGPISPPPPNNLKENRHRSMCLPVCFSSSTHPFDVLDDDDYPRTPRSPRMPELRDRCRNLISKIGGHRRRRAASADFSYDAYNYSLNFEDDTSRADDIIHRSRLPPSASGSLTPPEKSTTSRHILDDVILEEDEYNRSWRRSAPEKVPKSRNTVSRIGLRGRNRHSSTSADFSYEPSSYALNFEDDSSKADELGPDNGFMARLPHSPTCERSTTTNPPAKCSALRPGISAFS